MGRKKAGQDEKKVKLKISRQRKNQGRKLVKLKNNKIKKQRKYSLKI